MSTETTYLRLSELASQVDMVVQESFGNRLYWVVAEIANLSYQASRNFYYFDLVEKNSTQDELAAQFRCRSFTAGTMQIRVFEQTTGQAFQNDLQVLVQVQVVYHPRFGLQLDLRNVDPSFTLGQLEQRRRATLKRLLEKESDSVRFEAGRYITRNQEIPLPAVIQRIAIIASVQSAGYGDFVHALQNNPYGYQFALQSFHTEVQGEGNDRNFVQKILEVFALRHAFDAVVIIRGGGARTDLSLFDSYHIARAIARFPLPVLTGIGHQRDETIADIMAHTALKTPTGVAEFILDKNREFEEELTYFRDRITLSSQVLLRKQGELISDLKVHLFSRSSRWIVELRDMLTYVSRGLIIHPKVLIKAERTALAQVVSDLRNSSKRLLKQQEGYLGHYASFIKMADPAQVLKRGYAIVQKNGKSVVDPQQLGPGIHIDIQMHNATFEAEILGRHE